MHFELLDGHEDLAAKCRMLWFGHEMSPQFQVMSEVLVQLVVQFWKVLETLGGGPK